MMHRRTLVLSGLAGLLVPRLSYAAEDDPAGLLTAIYHRVSAGKGTSGGQFVWLEAKDRPKYLSKSLVAVWAAADAKAKEGEIGPIDFDPVTASQDPLVRSFAVATERQDASGATVAVVFAPKKGDARKQPHMTVRYDLVRDDGAWKIDDIRGTAGKQPWSVRELLRDFQG